MSTFWKKAQKLCFCLKKKWIFLFYFLFRERALISRSFRWVDKNPKKWISQSAKLAEIRHFGKPFSGISSRKLKKGIFSACKVLIRTWRACCLNFKSQTTKRESKIFWSNFNFQAPLKFVKFRQRRIQEKINKKTKF